MVVGLIPARSSPKNKRLLGGQPLVCWTLESARRAKSLDFIVVSTDDPEIDFLATRAGLAVFDRPPALAGPEVPDLPVVEHVLDQLEQIKVTLWDDDLIVLLRPTSPFRRAQDIDSAVECLRAYPEVSSLRSVVPGHSPQKLYREAGFRGLPYTVLVPYTTHHWANGPRQVLERVWRPVGYVDAVRATWPRRGSMEGPIIAALPVLPEYALDLDTDQDWAAAEAYVAAQGLVP